MSDVSLGTASANINVDPSGAQQGVRQALTAFQQLEMATATNWWGIRNLGLAFAALPAAVTAGVAAAVRSSMQWEDAMVGVARTSGLQGAALNQLEKDLVGIAAVTPVAATHLAEIAEAAGALGVESEDVAQFTKVVAGLAATTNLTEDAAATALARIAGLTGLTGAAYDNLASSILEAGRTTAATEGEITSIATRLAGVASVVGLTADQVIGISATLASVGARSQVAGTAMQRVFLSMQQAVANGGSELEAWAAIAHRSTAEFANDFQTSAAGALEEVITGLGRLGPEAAAALKAAGVEEQNYVRVLLALAKGQDQVNNEGFRLTNNLVNAKIAFQDGTAAAKAAEARARTLSGQIQILRNQLFEFSRTVGDSVVPFIRPVISFFGNLIRVIQALPKPIQGAIFVIVGITAALSGLVAAAIMVGARVVIAAGAIRNLRDANLGAILGIKANTSALNQNTAAATANAAAQAAAASAASGRGGGGIISARKPRAATDAEIRAINANLAASRANSAARAADTGSAAASVGAFAKYGSKAGKVAGVLTIALAALSVGITLWGNKLKKQAEEAQKATAANEDLVAAMQAQVIAGKPLADMWIKDELAKRKAMDTARALGISEEELLKIISNRATPEEAAAFIKKLDDAQKKSIPGTYNLGNAVEELRAVYKNSAAEAQVVIRTNGDLTGSDEELAESFRQTTEAAEAKIKAHSDLIDAMFAERNANLSYQDALREYREAMLDASRTVEKVADAEEDLRRARRNQQKAVRDVAEAERALSHAREDGFAALADAQDDLADAQDNYYESLEKIKDLEEELEKLRKGPTLREMLEATNKLKNAQLSLVRAHQKVEDAEWHLQYLREEGASNRDIKDAELDLEEARQDVNNETESVMGAEEDLNKLRDEAARQEAIMDMERDLAAARRDSQTSLREIREKELELNEVRRRVATDDFYMTALDDLRTAQDAVRDATHQVQDAEDDLYKARSGRSQAQQQEEAALRLEEALYAVAKANVERRKTEAEMKGVPLTAAEENQALIEELEKLVKIAPTPAAKKRMQDFIDILKKVPQLPKQKITDPLPKDAKGVKNPLDNLVDPPKKSLKDQIIEALGGPVGIGAIVGGLLLGPPGAAIGAVTGWLFGKDPAMGIGAGIGAVIGGVIGSVFGPLGTVIGAGLGGAIGAGIGYVIPRIPELFGSFKESISNFLANLPSIGESIGNLIGNTFNGLNELADIIGRFFKELPGKISGWVSEDLPSLVQKGRETLTRFYNAIMEEVPKLYTFWTELPGKTVSWLGDVAGLLWRTAKGFMGGLWKGIEDSSPELAQTLQTVWTNISRFFDGSGEWLKDAGYRIFRGLLDGMKDLWEKQIKPWLSQIGPSIIGLKGPPAKDAVLLTNAGELIMGGLHAGLQTGWSDVRSTLNAYSKDISEWSSKIPTMQQAGAMAGSFVPAAVQNVNNVTLQLETHTDADAQEIIGEFMWANRVRTR